MSVIALGCGRGPEAPDVSDGLDAVDAIDATDGGCAITGRDSATPGVTLTIGTGREATLDGFRALVQGDDVWLAPGTQGLQHFLVSYRATGINRQLVLLQARAVRASDCVDVGFLRTRLSWGTDPVDPSVVGVPALPVVISDDNDRFEYCTLLGNDVVLIIDIDDANGHTAHRELRLHAAGIDPMARPDQRDAWLLACARADAGRM